MMQQMPGATYLYVQNGGCMSKPGDKFIYESKPPELSTVADRDWNTFRDKVKSACVGFISEFWCLIPLVLVPISFGIGFLGMNEFSTEDGMDFKGQAITMGLSLSGGIGCMGTRYFTVNKNKQQDRAIKDACNAFQSATNGQITVNYETRFTGMCRPKGAQPYRAIAIVPTMPAGGIAPLPGLAPQMLGMAAGGMVAGAVAAAPQGMATMSVQVPPGAHAGQTLQVQSPIGQTLQLQIPPGVVAGGTFQVQYPTSTAPVVVAAPAVVTVANPTVVGIANNTTNNGAVEDNPDLAYRP